MFSGNPGRENFLLVLEWHSGSWRKLIPPVGMPRLLVSFRDSSEWYDVLLVSNLMEGCKVLFAWAWATRQPPSSPSRVLSPWTCHNKIILCYELWEAVLCWQCIMILDLLQVASWFLSYSHQIFWHFWNHTFNVDSLWFASGPSTRKEWIFTGILETLAAPYGSIVTMVRTWNIIVAVF